MKYVIGHYASNKGVTDNFLDYLKESKLPYYYLAHPLENFGKSPSVVTFFNGDSETVLRHYATPPVSQLSFLYNVIISLLFLWQHKPREVDIVYGIGSFNVLPGILLKRIYKYSMVFWGVDYSDQRFANKLMNSIYLWTETQASKYADLVVQPTHSQQTARQSKHSLELSKSLIIPNGITLPQKTINNVITDEIVLYYLGSLSKQHGVYEFINEMYVKRQTKQMLYVYGGGSDLKNIKDLIKKNVLLDRVVLKGSVPASQAMHQLSKTPGYKVGIAPYINTEGHAQYGDSLKIKEYIAYGCPYITSEVVDVDSNLSRFGFKYHSYQQLHDQYLSIVQAIDMSGSKTAIKQFSWPILFSALLTEETKRFSRSE